MINYYDVDILDLSSGDVRKTPMQTGWTEHSPTMYRERMCDCNLAGYRERGQFFDNGEGGVHWVFSDINHAFIAYEYITKNGCDHSMPPTRFKALRAHLDDGRTIELSDPSAT